MDAVGSDRGGHHHVRTIGEPHRAPIAVPAPDRAGELCLDDPIARYRWANDHPCGVTAEEEATLDDDLVNRWERLVIVDRRGI